MPVKLIPIEPPDDISPDDPLGLLDGRKPDEIEEGLRRGGRAIATIVRALDWDETLHPRNRLGQFIETPNAPKPYAPPSVPEVSQKAVQRSLGGMRSPAQTLGDAVVPKTGPKYAADADTDGGKGRTKRAGELIRPGQSVTYKGKEWEVSVAVDGHLVLDEASGKKAQAGHIVLGPADMAPDGTVPGLKVAKPRKITSKKGIGTTGNLIVIDPYVDTNSHDPSLAIPENSEISPEEWKRFGRADQLHYIDLMNRFGSWKGTGQGNAYHLDAPVQGLVDQLLQEFDDEIVQIVRMAMKSQKGGSSADTLSLVDFASTAASTFETREKAMELQRRLNDIISWDLYNRLRSPDVMSFHGDGQQNSMSWWKKLFKEGDIFSGLSQTYNAQFAGEWGSPRTIATPIAIRHLVLAQFVTQWYGTGFEGEKELAVVGRMKVDERTLLYDWHEIGPQAREWLTNITDVPRPGDYLDSLREHFDNGTKLPGVVVPPQVQVGTTEAPPPPPGATEAMAEYTVPEIIDSPYEPADLVSATNLPFRKVDEQGNPVPEIASEAGLQAGDFMVGLKGTLYWLGPNPDENSSFPLVYHKMTKNSDGSLSFTGEVYGFEGNGKNPYYFLKGNVPPTKPKDAPDFDPGAWQYANEDPIEVSEMPVGTKFKVNGKTYEKTAEGNVNKTPIMDMETGNTGTINSAYETVILLPKSGVHGLTILEPAKGMTISYEGKKHTITNVKKDGTISLKPSGGGKVIKIGPDDLALENLFDPSQWEIGEPTKLGNLKVGEVFQGGQGQQTVKPFKVLDVEGKKVQWQNLDTGEKGSSTINKTVRKLDPAQGSAGEAEIVNDPDDTTKPDVAAAVEDAAKPTLPDSPTDSNPYGLPDASLDGYKSKWGSGAKYKHDEIQDLAKGAIFRDKTGKQFQVAQNSTDGIIVTDGQQNYFVGDGSIRVRALPEADAAPFTDSPDVPSLDAPMPTPEPSGPTTTQQTPVTNIVPGNQIATLGGGTLTVIKTEQNDGNVTLTYENSGDGEAVGDYSTNAVVDLIVPDDFDSPTDAPEVLPPVQADNIDALPEADDFLPYKSKWGSGGKYTHDKISEMPIGTVLRDKNGKLWKVQSNEAQAVITDGQQNFQVDGNLRGRAIPGKTLTGPAPPITEKPYGSGKPIPGLVTPEPGSAIQLTDNPDQIPLSDLPQNSLVSLDDGESVYVVTGQEAAPGMALLLPAGTTNGGPKGVAANTVPQQVKLGEAVSLGPPPELLLKDMVDNESTLSELQAKTPEGYFTLPSGKVGYWDQYGIFKVEKDGSKIPASVTTLGSEIPAKVLVPGSAIPPAAAPKPPSQPEQTDLISNLGEGDEFEVEIDGTPVPFEVVTVGAANSWVKNQMTGQVVTLDNDNPTVGSVADAVKALNPTPAEAPSYPGGGGLAVAELQALTDAEVAGLPELPIKFYKSKWGSGGKYKHDFLSDLQPGDHFTPSGTTDQYILVKSVGGGVVLIYKPSDGTYGLANGKGRVRKV